MFIIRVAIFLHIIIISVIADSTPCFVFAQRLGALVGFELRSIWLQGSDANFDKKIRTLSPANQLTLASINLSNATLSAVKKCQILSEDHGEV